MEKDGELYYVSTPTAFSPVNPLAAIYEIRLFKFDRSYFQSTFSLKYDAPWLKGLSFKVQGAYDLTYAFGKVLSTPFKAMVMNLPNASTTNLTYYLGNDAAGNNISLSESASRASDFTTQSSVNYDRKFGKHAFNAIVLAETRENKGNALSATGSGLDFIALDELNMITNQTGAGQKKEPSSIGGNSSQARTAGFVGRLKLFF